MKKSAIRELDRLAAWLLDQGAAVKTTAMESQAPATVKDRGTWARRMMRKMEDTGRAVRDDVDNRSGGVWWVHPDMGAEPPTLRSSPLLTALRGGTALVEPQHLATLPRQVLDYSKAQTYGRA